MTPTFSPDLTVQALKFAAARHATQKIPGSDLPYILHPLMVFLYKSLSNCIDWTHSLHKFGDIAYTF